MRATCFAQSCFRVASRLLKKIIKKKLGRLGRPLRPGAGTVLCTIVFNSRKKKKSRTQGKRQQGKGSKKAEKEKTRKRKERKRRQDKQRKRQQESEKAGKERENKDKETLKE